jgi:hypothetical protein
MDAHCHVSCMPDMLCSRSDRQKVHAVAIPVQAGVVQAHLGTAALRRRRYFLGGPRTTKAVFCATSPPGVSFAPVAVSTMTAERGAISVGVQGL